MTADIHIQARRIKGGAVVTVTRAGRTRRYRVGLRRFNQLKWVSAVWLAAHGYVGRDSADLRLSDVAGYWETVRWLLAHGSDKAKRWLRS